MNSVLKIEEIAHISHAATLKHHWTEKEITQNNMKKEKLKCPCL